MKITYSALPVGILEPEPPEPLEPPELPPEEVPVVKKLFTYIPGKLVPIDITFCQLCFVPP